MNSYEMARAMLAQARIAELEAEVERLRAALAAVEALLAPQEYQVVDMGWLRSRWNSALDIVLAALAAVKEKP